MIATATAADLLLLLLLLLLHLLLLLLLLLVLPGCKELASFSLQIDAAEMRALRIWIYKSIIWM